MKHPGLKHVKWLLLLHKMNRSVLAWQAEAVCIAAFAYFRCMYISLHIYIYILTFVFACLFLFAHIHICAFLYRERGRGTERERETHTVTDLSEIQSIAVRSFHLTIPGPGPQGDVWLSEVQKDPPSHGFWNLSHLQPYRTRITWDPYVYVVSGGPSSRTTTGGELPRVPLQKPCITGI